MSDLRLLKEKALIQLESIHTLEDLEAFRLEFFGKKGMLTELMKGLGALSPEERSLRGANLNALKDKILEALTQRQQTLESNALNERLKKETLDITLPGRPEEPGRIHPISHTIEEIMTIFLEQGFTVEEGPDVEDDFHNFTALNIPFDHPARQEHDTFYMSGMLDNQPAVLRTHTSPVQIRTMREQSPPFRMVALGRTFRSDYDATHSPMFHQVEGLVIDKHIHMGHLKSCLSEFLKRFFEIEDLPIRFRPSFFPFTEPSAEVDIGCFRSKGELKIGGDEDWLEILGCGMVHPNVLENCGLDPEEYQGFAFGMGIERISMLKYGIPDLRLFYESDLRWLRHHGFSALQIPSPLLAEKR
jgi:phenylalanyl-tRNA synthetase alpha chain